MAAATPRASTSSRRWRRGSRSISVGATNDYGHPAPQTLERLARKNAAIYRTDMDGDVTIETDGRSVDVHAARGRQQALVAR